MADPAAYMGPNGAVCCASHKGTEGWARMSAAKVLRFRDDLDRMKLVRRDEPLCETCRGIYRRPEAAQLLTGGDV